MHIPDVILSSYLYSLCIPPGAANRNRKGVHRVELKVASITGTYLHSEYRLLGYSALYVYVHGFGKQKIPLFVGTAVRTPIFPYWCYSIIAYHLSSWMFRYFSYVYLATCLDSFVKIYLSIYLFRYLESIYITTCPDSSSTFYLSS
jgi:hypothetical protein